MARWLAVSGFALLLGSRSVMAGPGILPEGFSDSLVVGGLDFPIGMALLPGGRVLVIEQISSKVRLIVNGALATTDPVGVVPEVRNDAAGNERGLLGIAVDPGWPDRPYIYLHSTHDGGGSVYISRFRLTGDLLGTGSGSLALDPSSRYNLLTDLPDINSNHNGGTVRFGPDGMLYVSIGEDAFRCLAQDSTSLGGKILRLDVSNLPPGSGGPPSKSLITPPDNPFVTSSDENQRLVWAMGLRNPFRFNLDPRLTPPVLFIADVGQDTWEEIDLAPAGGLNFGWPLHEALPVFSSCSGVADVNMIPPAYAYNRSNQSAAVIGGLVYLTPVCSSCGFPAGYVGDYFFSDYVLGFLRRLKGSGNTWSVAPAVPGQPSTSDWGRGFEAVSDYLQVGGALWYCRQVEDDRTYQPRTGQIRRIVPTVAPPLPSIAAVVAPNGGEIWKAGSTHTIVWTASDPLGITSVDLAYSIDGGATWPYTIASAISNSGSRSWKVPDTPTAGALVRVTARRPGGGALIDVSDERFTIDTWLIRASAGANGSILPEGSVPVVQGANEKFMVTPASGFQVADVVVDGSSVGNARTYTFTNVADHHTIAASFEETTGPPAARGVFFDPPFPSPARGSVSFSFGSDGSARVRLDIYDVRGRHVMGVAPQIAGPALTIPWDGRDGAGRPVPPGVYIARLTIGDRALERRFPLLP